MMKKLILASSLLFISWGAWNPHLSLHENCERKIIEIDYEIERFLKQPVMTSEDEYQFIFLCGKKCVYYEILENVK
jgi:hypothetical protein